MVYEDFETFTEVDPDSIITVDSATLITVEDAENVDEGIVKKSYGAGHFVNTLQHDFTFTLAATSEDGSIINSWAIFDPDTIESHKDLGDEDSGYSIFPNIITSEPDDGNCRYNLREWANNETDYWEDDVENTGTTYYFSVIRNGETCSMIVYSDENRTVIVDNSVSVTGQDTAFKWVGLAIGREDGSGNFKMDATIENLDINEYTEEEPSIIYVIKKTGKRQSFVGKGGRITIKS